MKKIEFKNILDVEPKIRGQARIWRNRPEIRSNMLTQHIISEKEHSQWLDSLKKRKDRIVWIIYYQGIPIGSCYLHDIKYDQKQSEWGYYIGEGEYRGKGLSKFILSELMNISFNQLGLEKLITSVLKHNRRAYQIYQKFGFVEKQDTDNNNELIFLEMTEENWINNIAK